MNRDQIPALANDVEKGDLMLGDGTSKLVECSQLSR